MSAQNTPRELVRRYQLTYDKNFHMSLLTSVQMEGRCSQPTQEPLQFPTGCPTLPAMRFSYQHVDPFDTKGQPSFVDLAGYEGFDERIQTMTASPATSVDDQLTDLFDVDANGLPDVVVTDPGNCNGKHCVYFNGKGGIADRFTKDTIGVISPIGDNANTLGYKNPNVAPLDVDGDGIADLLHMPGVKTYAVYKPTFINGGWNWLGRDITTASQQSPKIDFGKDGQNIHVVDVDEDGLVDVLRSTGTEWQTFLSLGRYPGGDGQYGHAIRTGATTATISNDPISKCVPYSGTPVQLGDPDIKLGDMNGDGLVDIVRIRIGDMRYWPGRGDGIFGTGGDCVANTYGTGRDIAMQASPQYSNIQGETLRLDDINGDGLDDLIQVRQNDVDVWLNVDGVSWTKKHDVVGSPPSPSFADKVRLVDVNGSGTRDILWGTGGKYQYIDLAGARRPSVLVHVESGLGKTTDLEYSTSTALMLAAEGANKQWSSILPMPVQVVTKVTEKDNLGLVGRPDGVYVTTYDYRDPVYDGRQREFRGFRFAAVSRIGDSNSPTAVTESTFILGECVDENPNDNLDPCSLGERWRDNPREALKGLLVVSEMRDAGTMYESSIHHTYRLRRLYVGLDAREVRHAFEEQSDSYLYDDAPFVGGNQTASLPETELELTPQQVATDSSRTFAVQSNARAHLRSLVGVDHFGNRTQATAEGCIDGCAQVDESILTAATPGRRNDDSSGWMWRTVETYVVGQSNVKRSHLFTAYDVRGNPTDVTADLSGSLPLDRSQGSNTPPGASQDGTIAVSTTTYDGFGNVIEQRAPNTRCRTITYESDYTQLATSETVNVGEAGNNGCGKVALTANATYDRGLMLVTAASDLHNEKTAVVYDGFGRLTQVFRPDPDSIGSVSQQPSIAIEYFLTQNPQSVPVSMVHTQTQDGATPSTQSFRHAWAYVDGMARTIVALDQADPQAGDGGDWVASGLTDYDAKGSPLRVFLSFFHNGAGNQFPLSTKPQAAFTRTRYDAFGRALQRFALDGTTTLAMFYHSLGEDAWDAADLGQGTASNTPMSTLRDGHGRAIDVVERIHAGQNNAIEERHTKTSYVPTGERAVITRQRGSDTVVRWIRYDTLGRMVLNVEPSTSKPFNPDPSTDPSQLHAWRYSYNDNGDLAGTSDARGCGSNYFYDTGGRLIVEDYSPCASAHQAYSAPNLANGKGIEVLYRYDTVDPDAQGINNFPINSNLLLGRLTTVSDRASKTITRYDGRGRITGLARRIAKPGTPDDDLSQRYAPRWYVQRATFDGADRTASQSTGATAQELLGQNGESLITTSYTKRGTVAKVSSSYGDLVTEVLHDADGLPLRVEYADAAQTTTDFTYDVRRRLKTVQTYRGPPSIWTNPPQSYQPAPNLNGADKVFQSILEDAAFSYDEVDNPVEIHDYRSESVWPDGAKPVTRKAQYDDLYRLTKIDYVHSSGDDTWVSPFYAENNGQSDPRRGKPMPHVAFQKRVKSQTYAYDWLGNTTKTTDDATGFYDRSLGDVTNEVYELKSASAQTGSLGAAFDASGSLESMVVQRSGTCLPQNAICSHRFSYDWDEVGRLSRARRWDLQNPGNATDGVPQSAPDAELAYAYDASDQRVRKTAGSSHWLYVFGSVELRGATFSSDYEDSKATEVVYLFAHSVRFARLHYADTSLPTLTNGKLHVLFELPDHLGSTSIIVDKETSELVERSTYTAYGSADSDFRPSRWDAFREDYRHTTKEEDLEVGLTYFGKRFLSPALGRWVSADPLNVHGLGADLNVYAYVSGRALVSLDAVGFDGAKVWSALWRSVSKGDVSPRSEFAQALVHEDYGKTSLLGPGASLSEVLQDDRALKVAQNTVATATVGAEVTIATAGLGGNAILAATAGGISARGTSTALSGGGAVQTVMAATSPSDVAGDAELAVVAGGAAKTGQVAVNTARQGVTARVVTASTTVPPPSGGGTGGIVGTGGTTAIVKYDGEFAARQILGKDPVTPGGRAIMAHAADRMVNPPKGRATMTLAEVDQVLDTADKIKEIYASPRGLHNYAPVNNHGREAAGRGRCRHGKTCHHSRQEPNEMTTVCELRDLMRTFVNGADRSMETAGRIEVALDDVFGDQEPFSSLSLALASYRPEGGEFLFNEAEAVKMMTHALETLEKRLHSS